MEAEHHDWHIVKSINVGDVLTTLAIAGTAFIWLSSVESRVATLSTQVENIKASQAAQTESLRREMTYLRGSVDKLNDKLDRLIERP